jgi:hypothetical protein
MFKYKVLLIGASGRGKTYSFRNMNKETTAFINVENKPLPFKGQFKFAIVPEKPLQIITLIEQADANPAIDCVIVDSFSAFVDMLLLEARSLKTGYEIWNYYNENIGKFNAAVKKCKKEIFVTAHYEVITDELGGSKERRAKAKGKEWEGQIEKDYTMVLYTEAKVEFGEKTAKHFFTLYNDGTNSAKTPPDIFGEGVVTIENDSNLVLQKIREFTK